MPTPQEIQMRKIKSLLRSITRRLPRLKKLLAEISEHLPHEEGVYRFYHQSFKVYNLQAATLRVVAELQAVTPKRPLNSDFMTIITQGTGKKWTLAHNKKWLVHTRPIVEAFFHAKHVLEMVCQYGEELKTPPQLMPYGWATVLYLYNLR